MSKYDLTPCTHVKHVSNRDCYFAHERLTTEAAMIRGLIRGLGKVGYKPVCVFDGEEYVNGTTETATMDTVFSVDESTITFKGRDGEVYGVLIVLGNGVDCIPDWNVSRDDTNGWNAAIERVTDELYERHQ